MELGGVTLNVKDLEAAKAFYAKLPGSELIRDEPDIASFSFGQARVSPKLADEPGFHLEMESSDLDQVRNSTNIDEDKGDKVFVSDPDGHRIEVEKE
jgi:catechol 2,3-dioxygenase-like lactoylglutathione lyase family enzyme